MNDRSLPQLPSNLESLGHNRRDFLRRAAMLGVFGPAVLAACGGGTKSADGKNVRVASWPFYIENDQDPKSAATIKSLVAKGYTVEYQAVIDDNISFTEKFSGDLKAGKDFGFDLAIPTSWMTARWIADGWAQKIPVASVPNKSNIVEYLANPEWDKGREYSLPYAIGQVGLAYYPEKVGFEITSLKDFLKPELKGKVSILSELRDTVGTFMIMMGMDPQTASTADALKAIAEIKKYRDQGHFKKITGNSYTEDLTLGDTWAALGWSGDIRSVQAEKEALKWVLPGEKAMSFVDTMIIPKGGNAAAAAAWMNHIYDPAVAGPLYEAIGYTTPVKGAAEKMSEKAKTDVFINPPASAKLIEFRSLSTEDADILDTAFAAATQQ
jgi:spermidine/putrescine transport system substrate-binding protein